MAESRILIVEDNKALQKKLRKQCQRASREIEFEAVISIASNIEEAKSFLGLNKEPKSFLRRNIDRASCPFDLVTVDINLSGAEIRGAGAQGMELLRLIEDRLSNAYVVVASGEDNPEQMEEIFGYSRVVGYMRKTGMRNEVFYPVVQIVTLHANSLRQILDPKHSYREWKELTKRVSQIDTLQKKLVERGGPKLKFPESVQAEQKEYLDQDTLLPGQKAVEERLRLLPREDTWTIMVIQVDQLGKFKRIAGGEEGRKSALCMVADVTCKVLEEFHRDRDYFVGSHDNTIFIVTDLSDVGEIASQIRKRFRANRATLYGLGHKTKDGELIDRVVKIDVRIGTLTRAEVDQDCNVPDIKQAIAGLLPRLE